MRRVSRPRHSILHGVRHPVNGVFDRVGCPIENFLLCFEHGNPIHANCSVNETDSKDSPGMESFTVAQILR